MNHTYPIFTMETKCQDCYKCVRHCPVKAIKVENGHATVVPELCTACGHCVEVCPAKAKKVRDDLPRAQHLLRGKNIVCASLAPSWVSEFKDVPKKNMIAALKKLGFAHVSETALGAQLVSARTAEILKEMPKGVVLSSACPAAVDFVRKYMPNFASAISAVHSPVLSHCKMLREKLGNDIKTVFIGPCIAKKNEADRHPELLNLAMTFAELHRWFKEENISLKDIETTDEDKFFPETAEEGAIYPVEGGMNKTIKVCGGVDHVHFAMITGLHNLEQAFEGLRPQDVDVPVFVEMLACYGGCVHGPCTEHNSPGLLERLRVFKDAEIPDHPVKRESSLDITENFPEEPVKETFASLHDIKKALRSIGKFTPEDELNCGGCGYETCQNFARALIAGKAEPAMCVSYLRKQAQKKANALLRCIPSGVVIVDRDLKIIECNKRFAELFGEDTVMAFDAKPGMAGADIKLIVPFHDLFSRSLSSGKDIHKDSLRFENRLFNATIFNIEQNQVVGAVIFDVTSTELRREQIVDRAREVIDKNLATVQDIACKLGEHMAETEILLRSIAEDYADDRLTPPGKSAERGKGKDKDE